MAADLDNLLVINIDNSWADFSHKLLIWCQE